MAIDGRSENATLGCPQRVQQVQLGLGYLVAAYSRHLRRDSLFVGSRRRHPSHAATSSRPRPRCWSATAYSSGKVPDYLGANLYT